MTIKFKVILFFCYSSFFVATAQQLHDLIPNELVKPLPCGVWGAEDWTELNAYRAKQAISNSGAVIREYDQNINAVLWSKEELTYHKDPIVYRWEIKDTSIHYVITIMNIAYGKDAYRAVGNFCGLKIELNKLLSDEGAKELVVHVERVKNGNESFNWGLGMAIGFEENKKLTDNIQYQTFGIDDSSERYRAQADLYAANGMYADAFGTLEQALDDGHGVPITLQRYWHLRNQHNISQFRKRR